MPFPDIFLSDGHVIPGIAFGTGTVHKSKDVQGCVETAIDEGFSYIDTAQRA